MWDTILGILLAMIATLMFNISPILQKETVDKMDSIGGKNIWKSLLIMFKSPKWVIGLLLALGGAIPYFIALQISGILVVQPLMNIGFIVLVFASRKYLGEKINIQAGIAIGIMMIMPLFITLGEVSQPSLFESLWFYIGFMGIMIAISGIIGLIAKRSPVLWSFASGIWFALGALTIQAFTVILAIEDGNDIWGKLLEGGIFVILWGVINSVSAYLSQIALQNVSASRFNPINQTINNIVSIIGGIFIYSQFPSNWLMYAIGITLGLIGVLILGKYDIDKIELNQSIENSGENLHMSENNVQKDFLQ